MKRIFTIVAAILMTASVWAQAPEKMSYQAVVRVASNALVTTQVVGMQISIIQGSAIGTSVYVETQTPTSNANGLVSLEIGTGTLVSGDFTTIDWANDTYFIKTETDPAGGTNYTITGTSQLMSVPYALHAKTAETITGTITETDPFYTASEAANITATDITNLGNLSGTNTGDQDGSETKVTAGTNVTVTGAGTTASPYVVNAAGGSTPSRISMQGFDDDMIDSGWLGNFIGASSSLTSTTTLGDLLRIGVIPTTYMNGTDITQTLDRFNITTSGTYEIFISFTMNDPFTTDNTYILQLASNGIVIAASGNSQAGANGNPANMVIKYVGAFAVSDVIEFYMNSNGGGWRGKAISIDIQKVD